MSSTFNALMDRIHRCQECAHHLPLAPKPILQADPRARILIAGQAPGQRAHDSGLPFDDPSGDRLRRWLGVDRETFYDPAHFAIVPMGFCFPGKVRSGDAPPRPECAPNWREPLLKALPNIQLTLVLGRYALAYHLPQLGATVTGAVEQWEDVWPEYLPLPHPSPRNQAWFKRNPWFEEQVLPRLQAQISTLVPSGD
ncbi:uracil-DNA glycosylase family protein [Saccharospirillum impatiens]|uniref:uracil-DNA glycosylase family protein n=1 Tax=Saccharospirillum impatiens TaxID=169438 RepID=UPI0003F77ADC|nr:uracil-DNA glycosylase family protein [Saccharospirillum impatiens]